MQAEAFREQLARDVGKLAVKLDLAGFLQYVLEYSPELRMWTDSRFVAGLFEASCLLNKPGVLAAVVRVAEKHGSDIYGELGCPLHCALEFS